MTTTNRFLNRLLVLVAGLVLVAVGAGLATVALLPGALDEAARIADDTAGPAADAVSGGRPWVLWATAVVALLLIVLLVRFVVRQGRGRTSVLLRVDTGRAEDGASKGAVVVDAKVAQQAISDALSDEPAIAAVDVSAFDFRGTRMLRITAHARRGASPAAIRRTVDAAVSRWDAVLGETVPVVVQIVSGLRSRVGGETSRVV